MTLQKSVTSRTVASHALLRQLFELPELARTIQALPAQTFAALVCKVGVEDAAELVALATTEQLVQAFDEELFVNQRAGEREQFDPRRFAVWLEVLLEAGDEVAAKHIAQLDEDFVAHALSNLILVLDEDALRERLQQGDEEEVLPVDKALESALCESIDSYLLVAKQQEGWDAVLALVLALDRQHRALLERLLERLALASSPDLEDLEELWNVLTEAESLAEDVEAARETRRSRQGYVEPRAARAFLELAKQPFAPGESGARERDALTRAYFRELHTAPLAGSKTSQQQSALPFALQQVLALPSAGPADLELASDSIPHSPSVYQRFQAALATLKETQPAVFTERVEKLAYLANVIQSGKQRNGQRIKPNEAADAALATVCFGACVELRHGREDRASLALLSQSALSRVLGEQPADRLFRTGSSALASGRAGTPPRAKASGLLFSEAELAFALDAG